jgi:hypothetical protein
VLTPSRHPARLLRTLPAILACAAPLSGCRGHGEPRSHNPRPEPPRASPSIRGSGAGIELWWWVAAELPTAEYTHGQPTGIAREDGSAEPAPAITIDDGRLDLEDGLRPYMDRPVPLPAEMLERWRASGFRIVAIPRADIEVLEPRLRLSGAVSRQWLGQVTRWTDIAQGPWDSSRRTVQIEGESAQLPPGRLRLSLRCWSIPGPNPAAPAPLQIEIIPELEPFRTDEQRLLIAAGLAKAEDASPATFDRLRLIASLTTEDALVIFPDLPAQIDPQPLSPSAPRSPSAASYASPPPPMPAHPTLAEAMLARTPEGRARARAVIVLLPTIAPRFDLLGPT